MSPRAPGTRAGESFVVISDLDLICTGIVSLGLCLPDTRTQRTDGTIGKPHWRQLDGIHHDPANLPLIRYRLLMWTGHCLTAHPPAFWRIAFISSQYESWPVWRWRWQLGIGFVTAVRQANYVQYTLDWRFWPRLAAALTTAQASCASLHFKRYNGR